MESVSKNSCSLRFEIMDHGSEGADDDGLATENGSDKSSKSHQDTLWSKILLK